MGGSDIIVVRNGIMVRAPVDVWRRRRRCVYVYVCVDVDVDVCVRGVHGERCRQALLQKGGEVSGGGKQEKMEKKGS